MIETHVVVGVVLAAFALGHFPGHAIGYIRGRRSIPGPRRVGRPE